MRVRALLATLALTAAALLATTAPAQAATNTTSATLALAGDIACAPVTATTCQQKATARVISAINPRYVLPLGDLAYPSGNLATLNALYDPAWGPFKAETKPVPGNHEGTGSGYYTYFQGAANPQAPSCRSGCLGYYSYDVAGWHIVALNTSACSETTGACPAFTAQTAWLKADLAAHKNLCTLAYMHHPYFSVGASATKGTAPLYQALLAAHVDLAVTGHFHAYERFAPQNLAGTATATGLTEIVAGTGGATPQPPGTAGVKNRVAAFSDYGVLKLSLTPTSWTSSFHATSGAVRDTTTGTCH